MKSKVPEETVETINVLYFPQIGYLICVPLNDEWREREDFDIEGWTYQVRSSDFLLVFEAHLGPH
jgi:DNA mismatch repair protein MSH5